MKKRKKKKMSRKRASGKEMSNRPSYHQYTNFFLVNLNRLRCVASFSVCSLVKNPCQFKILAKRTIWNNSNGNYMRTIKVIIYRGCNVYSFYFFLLLLSSSFHLACCVEEEDKKKILWKQPYTLFNLKRAYRH